MTKEPREINWNLILAGATLLGSLAVGYFSGIIGTQKELGAIQTAQAALETKQMGQDQTNEDFKTSVRTLSTQISAVNQNLIQLLLKSGISPKNLEQ